MLCKLLTAKVVMGLPLPILWGNDLEEWVILAANDYHGIVGEDWEWYPLQRSNSVPRRLFEIHTTPPHSHLAHISARDPILVVTMPAVAEIFKNVIYQMTPRTDFKLINLLHSKNAYLAHEDLNTSINQPEHRWIIQLVSYDTSTSRKKPSSNGRLSHCSWSLGIADKSHGYKTMDGVGWRIATNARIGFKLQVTAMPGFHSLYDWCYQAM
jgi:hypothetical protein